MSAPCPCRSAQLPAVVVPGGQGRIEPDPAPEQPVNVIEVDKVVPVETDHRQGQGNGDHVADTEPAKPDSGHVFFANRAPGSHSSEQPKALKPAARPSANISTVGEMYQTIERPFNILTSCDMATMIGVPTLLLSIYQRSSRPQDLAFFVAVDTESALGRLRRWLSAALPSDINLHTFVRVMPANLLPKRKPGGSRPELEAEPNFARFFFAEIFPEATGRAFYIDSDCLVLGDVMELQTLSLKENEVMAVKETCETYRLQDFINVNHTAVKPLGIDPDHCAFNAGVFLWDVAKWKHFNITAEVLKWISLNAASNNAIYGRRKGGGVTQPALMLALQGKHGHLPPIWHVNSMGGGQAAYGRQDKDALASPKLMHWSGARKPWLRKTPDNISGIKVQAWRDKCVPEPPVVVSSTATSLAMTALPARWLAGLFVPLTDAELPTTFLEQVRSLQEQSPLVALNCVFD
ncbi:hypothetical protein CAOG_06432 [Capsaspora owczarzaki ATCC 30864]|uniref:hypothetical protein n=1 Tax=Capsaspora owczarzaki (strain ATCC 30864) TaxID=595528 RepID=UPI0001FE2B9E|nr:hypothetical protein CAOG_06432 [Capsaspora owczarzaki ATCC 30864]|eukprot:XP_004345181.1 hypothetical protein CAOG_06432 [Capsaspora owczarzaki ATCC 30864]